MMDWPTIISSVASSVGITAAGTWWLGKTWISHRLNAELEKTKGDIKKEVETELADKAAQRDYEYSAKQRLYSAIGPLKFQLLIACRDMSQHIRTYGLENVRYSLEPSNYYGKSSLYRIIVPLVFVELIERQVAVADFSVDPEAVELLRFKKSAYRAYKSDKPILNHPNAYWNEQRQHLFHHTISKMVDAIIIADPAVGSRPMYFREFEELLVDEKRNKPIIPLVRIIEDFSIEIKPIFWIRLVFLAHIAGRLVNQLGVKIGFQHIDIDAKRLLTLSDDIFVQQNSEKLVAIFDALASEGL
ncbi:MAG: hypothetical protein ACXV79_00835 [Methylobacter sp.]